MNTDLTYSVNYKIKEIYVMRRYIHNMLFFSYWNMNRFIFMDNKILLDYINKTIKKRNEVKSAE